MVYEKRSELPVVHQSKATVYEKSPSPLKICSMFLFIEVIWNAVFMEVSDYLNIIFISLIRVGVLKRDLEQNIVLNWHFDIK